MPDGRSTRMLGWLAAIAAVGQGGLIIWASCTGGSVVTALVALAQVPWGLTTLTDLYLGLLLVGLWMYLLQRGARRAWPWWLGLFILGNFTTVVFLWWRCVRHRTLAGALLAHPE